MDSDCSVLYIVNAAPLVQYGFGMCESMFAHMLAWVHLLYAVCVLRTVLGTG
jgi:hypothetical protein